MNLQLLSTINDIHSDLQMNETKQILDELKHICEQLDSTEDYSTEAFSSFLKNILVKIGNLASHFVLTNRTNLVTLFKGLKRSEIRWYTDRYSVTVRMIDGLSFDKVMNLKIPKPTGMKVTYRQTMDMIKQAYKDLEAHVTAKEMDKHLKNIYKEVMAASKSEDIMKKLDVSNILPYYKARLTVLESVVDNHQKCFQSDSFEKTVNTTKEEEFKNLFNSMKEFTSVKEDLLNLEKTYIGLRNLSSYPESMSKRIDNMIDAIQTAGYEVNKKFVQDLAYIVRTMAMTFDMIGTILKTQMMIDHHMVMIYERIDSKIVIDK